MVNLPIQKPDNLPFPCSTDFYKFCWQIHNKINNKNTVKVGVLFGDGGAGKSLVAQHIGYIVNGFKDLEQKSIAFDKKEFVNAVVTGKKETVIGDEGIDLFLSRNAMGKDAKIMISLMGQMRQNNLLVLICVPIDLLLIDKTILKMSNFVIEVYETTDINKETGKETTLKGNCRIYPHYKRRVSMKDKLIQYLRSKVGNPFLKIRKPLQRYKEKGTIYIEGKEEGVYCCDKEKYLERKFAILKPYLTAFKRKAVNRNIDYAAMDKLIKSGMALKRIGEILNCSHESVILRKTNFHPELVKHRKKGLNRAKQGKKGLKKVKKK